MNSVYRHVKSLGIYRVLQNSAKLESTLEEVVVYQNVETKDVWVRSKKEFYDGRFKLISPNYRISGISGISGK